MPFLPDNPPYNIQDARPWLVALNDAIDPVFNAGTQAAHKVLAGPTSGLPATPSYRLLVASDLPEVVGTNFANQSANTVFSGPSSGSPASPTFRTLVSDDIPELQYFTTDSTNESGFRFKRNDVLRWLIYKDDDNESGFNTGSTLKIRRYDDSGTLIDDPLRISRANGLVSITNLTVNDSLFANTLSTSEQNANTFFGGPTSGLDAQPTFRSIVNDDLPVVDVPHGGTGVFAHTTGALLLGNGVDPITNWIGDNAGDFVVWTGSAYDNSHDIFIGANSKRLTFAPLTDLGLKYEQKSDPTSGAAISLEAFRNTLSSKNATLTDDVLGDIYFRGYNSFHAVERDGAKIHVQALQDFNGNRKSASKLSIMTRITDANEFVSYDFSELGLQSFGDQASFKMQASSGGYVELKNVGSPNYPYFDFVGGDGTIASPEYTVMGQRLGKIGFKGYNSDSTTFLETALIYTQATQDYNGAGKEGSLINFVTTQDNTAVQNEFRMDQNGVFSANALRANADVGGDISTLTLTNATDTPTASLVWTSVGNPDGYIKAYVNTQQVVIPFWNT